MDWLRENWFWIVLVVLFFWMHTKMHGGHGAHGGHGGCCGGHGEKDAAADDQGGHDHSSARMTHSHHAR